MLLLVNRSIIIIFNYKVCHKKYTKLINYFTHDKKRNYIQVTTNSGGGEEASRSHKDYSEEVSSYSR